MSRFEKFRLCSNLSKTEAMKKILAGTAIFIFTFSIGSAQPYSFSQNSSAYIPLSGATVLTSSAPWTYATAFTVPIGFPFSFMSSSFNTLYVEGSGFTYFDFNYYNLLLPYTVKLQSKGSSGNNSPVSYLLSGSSPNRILKVEWKNAGFYYDTTSTVNFQLWLYESTWKAEVHIGPNNIPNPALVFQENGSDGPVTGIYKYTSPTNCSYGLALTGAPSAASAQSLSGNINLFGTSLNAPPADGTVYIFDPAASGLNDEQAAAVCVFPQPANEKLVVAGMDCSTKPLYQLTDLAGRIIAKGNFETDGVINTGLLPAGTFLLQIESGNYAINRVVTIVH
ncbi:MAG: hypothetical protein FD123_3752 [Bacteroidetes bacterium]|nr:MAG: hypothetical protein FD123_3752 [Bacteroidota bacterium]